MAKKNCQNLLVGAPRPNSTISKIGFLNCIPRNTKFYPKKIQLFGKVIVEKLSAKPRYP
jgi:hypothetical protein